MQVPNLFSTIIPHLSSNPSLEELLQSSIRNSETLLIQLYTKFVEIAPIQGEIFVVAPHTQVTITNVHVINALRDIFIQAREQKLPETKLTTIAFKNCRFDFLSWCYLLKILGESKIESVVFYACQLTSDFFTRLTHEINKGGLKLERLAVANQDPIDPHRIQKFLEENKSLKQLVLDSIQLDDTHVAKLKRTIEEHPSIESLCLNNNFITSAGAIELISAACKSKSLNDLQLNKNDIEEENFKFFEGIMRHVKPNFALSLKENRQEIRAPQDNEFDSLIQNWVNFFRQEASIPPLEILTLLKATWKLFTGIKYAIQDAEKPSQGLLNLIYGFPINSLKESLFLQMLKKTFKKHRVPGDGNCLFSTIVFLMNQNHSHSLDYVLTSSLRKNNALFIQACREYKTLSQAQLLRLVVVDYIRTHPDYFKGFIERQENETEANALQSYCDNMKKSFTWAGDPEIQAICNLFADMGEPLPPLVILDLTKKPNYHEGEFVMSDILTRQNDSNEPPFYVYRELERHFSPLTKRISVEHINIEELPVTLSMEPLRLTETCRKVLENPISKVNPLTTEKESKRPFGAIVEELENSHHYLLRFVISKYLKQNKSDFKEEILTYSKPNFVSLLDKINSHFRAHHPSDKEQDDIEVTSQIFEDMGAPIKIHVFESDVPDYFLNDTELDPQTPEMPLIFLHKREGIFERISQCDVFVDNESNSSGDELEGFVFVEED